MENTKLGRRRTHEPDWEGSNHAKRKRKRDVELDTSDSVQIVGETHANNLDLKHLGTGNVRGPNVMESSRRLLPNGACAGAELSGLHGNGIRGSAARGGAAKDRLVNGGHRGDDTHSPSAPALPPSLRESERMLFVQQWINTIPPDQPFWVQTSLNKIVPITNPEYYPEENDCHSSSDRLGCEGSSSADQTRLSPPGQAHHHHSLNASNRIMGYSSVAGPLSNQTMGPYHEKANLASRTTTVPTNAGMTTANANAMLGPRHPNNTAPGGAAAAPSNTGGGGAGGAFGLPHGSQAVVHSSSSAAFHPTLRSPNVPHPHGGGNVDHLTQMNTGSGGGGGYSSYQVNHRQTFSHQPTPQEDPENGHATRLDHGYVAPAGRLFDDLETEMVVKLFRDYFTKGSCPILSEVRRRTVNTPLDGRRTPISIRAKIKRLQTSGRWTNYTGL